MSFTKTQVNNAKIAGLNKHLSAWLVGYFILASSSRPAIAESFPPPPPVAEVESNAGPPPPPGYYTLDTNTTYAATEDTNWTLVAEVGLYPRSAIVEDAEEVTVGTNKVVHWVKIEIQTADELTSNTVWRTGYGISHPFAKPKGFYKTVISTFTVTNGVVQSGSKEG